MGQLKLVSEITQESCHLVFAVLHLGRLGFPLLHSAFLLASVDYGNLKADRCLSRCNSTSAAQTISAMTQQFEGSVLQSAKSVC